MTKKKNKNIKFCRREGENLDFFSNNNFYLKTRSLLTPGEHGNERGKVSDFGLILRTKQKIKRYFCIFEKQFKKIYNYIKKNFLDYLDLINLLERRLDNLVFRMNFSISRKESKQLILHGFVYVNFIKIKSPSFLLSPGDIIFINIFFLKKKFLFDYKKNFYNWIFNDYFNGKGLLLFLPKNNFFLLNKNLLLDIYK